MFRFIHAADIHLDSPLHKLDMYEGAPVEEFRRATRRAFENLVQTAISEEAAFVLIAGDLADGDWKDYNTGLYLVSQLARLRDALIPVFIVAGNHDAAGKMTRKLRFPDNVRLFPSDRAATERLDNLRVAVHGQSFATPAVTRDLSAGYPDAVKGYYNIGLLHTCATGRDGYEPYAPCSPEALMNKGYDYWALGHIHQHEVLCDHPPILFAGCTQGRHTRETGPKGCLLVSVGDGQTICRQFVPLDVVRWGVLEVDAAGAADGYEVIDRLRRGMEELLENNDGMPLALRVHIRGETAAHAELAGDMERWFNEVRSAALSNGGGRIWIEKIRIATRPPAAEQAFEHAEGAIGELLALLDELASDPGRQAELSAELSDLSRKLPSELKTGEEGLRFEDPGWMSELLAQVRPMLTGRLLRKGAPHEN